MHHPITIQWDGQTLSLRFFWKGLRGASRARDCPTPNAARVQSVSFPVQQTVLSWNFRGEQALAMARCGPSRAVMRPRSDLRI